MEKKIKTKRDPLLHVTRKQDVPLKSKWISRVIAIAAAFILCALVSSGLGSSFVDFFVKSFDACFVNLGPGGAVSATKILGLLEETGILLLLALSVIPAFKMKFWNLGAEGQVIIAVLMCATMQKYLGGAMNLTNGGIRFIFFIITFAASVIAGMLWALIPAIFKAKFNTNETLFTLMMNYVALILTKVVINVWDKQQGDIRQFDKLTYFPEVGDQTFVINIIIIAVVATLVFLFLKYTKRGYEINIVGGSTNTAKYIGLSVKKTIIRTMLICGAICGLCGFLLVCGEHNNLTATVVNGRGFTGVLIAWIGGLGPIEITLYSLLGAYITKGGHMVNNNIAYPNIMLALFFFVLIVNEFFVNYQVRCDKLEAWYRPIANKNIVKFQKRFPKLSEKIMKKHPSWLTPYNINVKKVESPTNINGLNKEGK